MNRAVLWDMDGTLIDSAEYHWITWHDTLAELGVALTRESFNGWFGSRNDRILRRYFGDDFPLGRDRTHRRAEGVALSRARARSTESRLLPGVERWLYALQQAGWQQAVASSAPPANIDVLLEVLDLQQLFASDGVGRGSRPRQTASRRFPARGREARRPAGPLRRRRRRAGRRRGGPARWHAHDWHQRRPRSSRC